MRLNRCFIWLTLLCLLVTALPALSENIPLELPEPGETGNEIVIDPDEVPELELGDEIPGDMLLTPDIGDLDLELIQAPGAEDGDIDSPKAREASNIIEFWLTENTIPDPALRSAIAAALGIGEGEIAYEDAIASLERLNLANLGIRSLKGLELLTEIKELDLSGNPITTSDYLLSGS